ncbi:hypothetical protein SAZ10_29450 [Mesorhizobium sp. BAC0120]|uniref:hypothetical protein n=1 Tax=Mesorhizobium sp. BAC0120 TaxID=3090670 RepID=UPI00298BEC4B|nr:hypothetical protein [Mesorhizobium sp. BAC0120]MDW6025893.1 hypothetical protein [Mesorhizobium sp. BAC0120]
MLKVVQALDRAPIGEVQTDDAAALEPKLQAAERACRSGSSAFFTSSEVHSRMSCFAWA